MRAKILTQNCKLANRDPKTVAQCHVFISKMSPTLTTNRRTNRGTSSQRQQAQAVFGHIARDEQRFVDVEDLAAFFEQWHESRFFACVVVYLWDQDGDRRLSFDDFLEFYLAFDDDGFRGVRRKLRDLLANDSGDAILSGLCEYCATVGTEFSAAEIVAAISKLDAE
jgi:Ca2+-binding EF-hand superfamily protein